jgi:hypothetical protein
METCDQCRYWDRYNPRDDASAPCIFPARVRESHQTVPRNSAVIFVRVADDHGLNVQFYTGPRFGCVNFDQSSQVEG